MSEKDQPEVTRRGLFEEIAGEAEEKVGDLLGNEHLTAEGRHKQAEAEGELTEPGRKDAADPGE